MDCRPKLLCQLFDRKMEQFAVYESYIDQYLKTMQSDAYQYHKLTKPNQNHKTSANDFSIKTIFNALLIFSLYFDQTRNGYMWWKKHLESYNSTECIPNWKKITCY